MLWPRVSVPISVMFGIEVQNSLTASNVRLVRLEENHACEMEDGGFLGPLPNVQEEEFRDKWSTTN